MTTITTNVPRARTRERVVVETISVENSYNLKVELTTNAHGSPLITLNGEPALVITRKGYLRRLPDGRIAMKKATDTASA